MSNETTSTQSQKWYWWAGRDEEWLTIGPCSTREAAIAEALSDIGEGEGSFVVMEGIMPDISLSASRVIDNAYEDWGNSNLFSTEHDAPEPCGTKEEQAAAEADLQALLDGWVTKWRHTLPTPNMFAATRNQETVPNDEETTA